MKHAGSYPYTTLIAGAAFINTLTVCAAGQSVPASPPVPISPTSPTASFTPEREQETGTTPLPAPFQSKPSRFRGQTTSPSGNQPVAAMSNAAKGILPAQSSQRMAEGTRRILALRRLLQLGFNTAECTRALRLLERLRDVRTAPPDDPEKALEEEYRALLVARPTDPLPPSSAAKIMDAARFYRDEQAKVWADMTREIGAARAEGLRLLIGQGGNSAFHANKPKFGETLPHTSNAAGPNTPVPVLASSNPNTPSPIDGGSIGQPQLNTIAPPMLPNGRTIVVPSASETSDYTLVVYSLTTVRLSLDEMINLLREKIDAMNGMPGSKPF